MILYPEKIDTVGFLLILDSKLDQINRNGLQYFCTMAQVIALVVEKVWRT